MVNKVIFGCFRMELPSIRIARPNNAKCEEEMKDYVSICHCTSNENGQEEIELESSWPLWQGIWFAISGANMPDTKKETFVVQGTVWAEKETGKIPDSKMQFELFECKGWVKRQTKMTEFFGDYE